MAKVIALGLALLAFWLALSGHYTPFLLGMGVLSTGLCVYVASRMGLIDAESVPTQLRFSLLFYWAWLLIEIIKSNYQVARIILSPRINLGQQLVLVPTAQTTDMGRVIFANSITLTPGTVTVEIAGQALLVHAMTADFVPSMEDMGRHVAAVEEGKA
ncbi:MAG: Na+/H+ antiporter subunit E [Parvibaculum sp.]|nr:Na+/H+ antiporter subunit E [Parvibaculum sp.]